MTRRNALIGLALGAVVLCLVSAARFLDAGRGDLETATVEVPAPAAAPKRSLLEVEGVDEKLPFYLVRDESGELLALVARDPHSGCDVDWLPDYDASQFGEPGPGAFKANCTGWVFSRDGRVLFGAAPRGLDSVVVTLKDGGSLAELDLSHFILGPYREAGQAGCSPSGLPQFVSTLPLPVIRPRP